METAKSRMGASNVSCGNLKSVFPLSPFSSFATSDGLQRLRSELSNVCFLSCWARAKEKKCRKLKWKLNPLPLKEMNHVWTAKQMRPTIWNGFVKNVWGLRVQLPLFLQAMTRPQGAVLPPRASSWDYNVPTSFFQVQTRQKQITRRRRVSAKRRRKKRRNPGDLGRKVWRKMTKIEPVF